ncbi:MAG: hypothetical protein HY321_12520 [Armatimonadetes bacterium]|nr:hypothetical protein [Armatimonadota bacterium]
MRRWCVLLTMAMAGLPGMVPPGAVAAEEEGTAPPAPVVTTSYPGVIPPGGGKRAWKGPAVRIRFEFSGAADAGKPNVQYLHPDMKQRPKFVPLDLPAEVTFACNPPRSEKKDEFEYRLVFAVPAAGATNMLYARLLVYRETEFTQNSVVKVIIDEKIAAAVASGEVQIIKVKDPQIQAALAAQGGSASPPAKGKKEVVIPGVGPEEILSLTIGNRAFGS